MDNSQNHIGYFPQMPVTDKHLSVELNSDFSLPDYQPEIRRLLSTRLNIVPPSEYADNNGASFEGTVNYKILYLGADGKLYSASLSDKYSFSIPLDFNSHSINNDEITLIPSCKCENVNTRVLGPRKLNVRTKLHCHALALSSALYSPHIVGTHNSASIESLVLDTPSISVKKCTSQPIVLNDFISLDSQMDDMRIIDINSGVSISECAATTDKINVRGEVVLKILYCNDVQSDYPLTLVRKIPLSSSLPCDGISNSFDCLASGSVIDEQINIDESGVKLEISLVITAIGQKNESVPYTNDAYSTERTSENKNMDVPIFQSVKCSNGNLSQNEVFSVEEIKLSPDAKIIDVSSRPTINELNWENEKLILTGVCEHQLIYHLDEEYSAKELSAPFRYEIDMRSFANSPSILKWNASACASHSRARCDGERLFIDCELNFGVSLQKETKISVLDEMILGERVDKCSGELLLCYPDKEATLWSVAKQYGIPQRKIKAQNSIPENEQIIKKKFLII